MNITDGLKSGQFPVRVGGFSYNGYGAVTSVFYPDLMLYPLAMMVMTVLPLFILGLWEVIAGKWRHWPLLMLDTTLVFQNHMCTTLLCAALAMCTLLISVRKLIREKARLTAFALAAGATLMINLGTLFPFLMLYLNGVNTATDQFGFLENTVGLRELFLRDNGIGQLMWPGILAALCALMIESEKENRKKVGVLLAVTGMTVLLATLPVALCGGYGIAKLLHRTPRIALLTALTMGLIGVWPCVEGAIRREVVIEFGCGATPYVVYLEYQYTGTDVHNKRSREVLIQGDVQLTHYQKKRTKVSAQLYAAGDAQLTFLMFGFDGCCVELNGEKINWRRGGNNCLTIDVMAGTSGVLQIRYTGKAFWRIAKIASLLSAIGLGYMFGAGIKRAPRRSMNAKQRKMAVAKVVWLCCDDSADRCSVSDRCVGTTADLGGYALSSYVL